MKKMQAGGVPIQLRSLAGQKKDTTAGPVDYSKMGKGLLPKGTVVDSKYSRDKKLKESKLNNKKQKGGSVDGPMEARRKIMGEKKPSLKKTLNYVKKHGSGLIFKDKSKLQEGTYKPTMQKGGSKKTKDSIEDKAVKRYPNYLGKDTAYDNAKKDVKSAVKGAKTVAKTVVKISPQYQAAKGTDDFLEKRYPNYFGKGTMYSKLKKGLGFKKGGVVKKNKAC